MAFVSMYWTISVQVSPCCDTFVEKLAVSHHQGLSQAAPLRQSRTAIGIVPLKNGQGDNLSPSKFREKNSKGSTYEEIYFSTEIAS